MKIKEGFILRNVADSWVILAVGQTSVDFNGMISLNETGAFLWQKIEEGCDRDGLIKAICGEYDVAEDVASADVDEYIAKLSEAGCIES